MICYFLFRVMANPEKPPAIDWSYYQNRVAVPGLVESFKKQYEALQVPYPVDKVTAQVDAQEKEAVSLDNFLLVKTILYNFLNLQYSGSCHQGIYCPV